MSSVYVVGRMKCISFVVYRPSFGDGDLMVFARPSGEHMVEPGSYHGWQAVAERLGGSQYFRADEIEVFAV